MGDMEEKRHWGGDIEVKWPKGWKGVSQRTRGKSLLATWEAADESAWVGME